MALRCLLFCADEETSAPIRQVLAGLGVEGESCSEGPAAVEKLSRESFQIVILNWDRQPEAGLLLAAVRERRPAERPLTLAIVSNDAGVPKALQAGANSILRKPILANHVQETLKTARDLLRARESAAQAAAVPAGAASRPPCLEQGSEGHLRAGEFLQSSAPAPGAEFVVESETQEALRRPTTETVDPLKELEPTAAAVVGREPAAPPPAAADEPRGLAWLLKQRAGRLPPVPPMAAAPAPAKPELIGYDQMPSPSQTPPVSLGEATENAAESVAHPAETHEQRSEAQLFAYITGQYEQSEKKARRFWRLGKEVIIGTLALAACAVVAAPQAPWHARVRAVWARGQRTVHAWLNPQPVTTPQAPASHEDFARPGDEYKLPVGENIPDATTDPAQIRVVAVVDPTAKKPVEAGANGEQTAVQGEGAGTNPTGQGPAPAIPAPEVPPAQPTNGSESAASGPAAGTASPGAAAAATAAAQLRSDAQAAATSPPAVAPGLAQPAPPISSLPHSVSTPATTSATIPSSLKSQIASMTPEASGTKPPEAALPSIEPVAIPEATARGLASAQPAPAYPASAQGQQGTVVLQVLIGRDGAVQDAKFLQGSLAFARAAIDGVKQWKFKPYMMNGQPVSVQTNLTISFQPGS